MSRDKGISQLLQLNYCACGQFCYRTLSMKDSAETWKGHDWKICIFPKFAILWKQNTINKTCLRISSCLGAIKISWDTACFCRQFWFIIKGIMFPESRVICHAVMKDVTTLHKKWSFTLRISSVYVTKSGRNCRFGHIYWRNP